MSSPRRFLAGVASALLLPACGSTPSTSGDATSTSTAVTTTGTTTATTTTSTTSVVVACGPSLHCSAPEVCVIDDPVPACTKLTKGATCPESAPQQQCATGVELYDCCCIPAAAIAYRCVSAAACGDAPACECTPTGCLEGLECQPDRSAARTFHCGEHLWY